ncbi:hypothetical protein HNQ93_003221 [Hymenobacter luteus]|uniref:DUF389 domain-containing protein n=2 Tax=Hymenobacter TaxID=89966 RepID=A0A7W9T2M1_9BACT|nr:MULTISPECIES: DUF389 domain-containing protein [Hymenobacter]MBB4602464.1 hypothetical protein [Hymenobacter latericoloratus]MBB6060355.1 hypothetical protein [Hymenobacter luteus]
MHRILSFTVPPSSTNELCQQLASLEEVITLTVQAGASRKPAGDVLTVHVLNRGVDAVLRQARATVGHDTDLSVTTSEATSFIAPAQQETVENDKDEALWEEMESGLRHQGRITTNYLLLMGLGGIICTVGLVAEPVPQAVAFVSSAIIAPGFDPMAKVPLALVLKRWSILKLGIISTLVGYAFLVLCAALTMYALIAAGESSAAALASNPEVQHIVHPKLTELLPSASAALAGVVMLAAFRRSFQAGPLVALAIIPAAALIGAGLVTGQPTLAYKGLERFALDWVFIIGAGVILFGLKQALVHKRQPLA